MKINRKWLKDYEKHSWNAYVCLFKQSWLQITLTNSRVKKQIFKETSHEPWWTVMEHWSPGYHDAVDAAMDPHLHCQGGCSTHHPGASPGHDGGQEWAGHPQLQGEHLSDEGIGDHDKRCCPDLSCELWSVSNVTAPTPCFIPQSHNLEAWWWVVLEQTGIHNSSPNTYSSAHFQNIKTRLRFNQIICQ